MRFDREEDKHGKGMKNETRQTADERTSKTGFYAQYGVGGLVVCAACSAKLI